MRQPASRGSEQLERQFRFDDLPEPIGWHERDDETGPPQRESQTFELGWRGEHISIAQRAN
jgi:hypothetical protein